MNNQQGLGKLLRMRSVLIVNIVLIIIIAWGFVGEFVRNAEMKKEINRLEVQASELETKNDELEEMTERYAGSTMLEREARLKLNLKKPGEEVVVIKESEQKMPAIEIADSKDSNELDTTQHKDNTNNIMKWLGYLFPTGKN